VMTNMIEPVLIIVMSVGVGFLLLSVLSAMFSIISNISRKGMSPGAKDFSSTRRTGGGGYGLHGPCAGNGGRYSQPGLARPHLRPGFRHRPRAFTLIEIMIVVGIMAS